MHFEAAVSEVFRAEGGLLTDPGEPGGASNFGISIRALRAYRKDESIGSAEIAALTIEEAKAIYRQDYWDKLGLDKVSGRLSAIAIMDQAVNRGVGGVKALLRECLNKRFQKSFPEDAWFSEMVDAVNAIEDRVFFRRFICDAQNAYVEICASNPAKAKWLKGWLVRTHNLLKLLV